MLTTEEEMALAVLRKDMTAARQLADKLMEEYAEGGVLRLPVTRKITVPMDQIRVIIYVDEVGVDGEDIEIDQAAIRTAINNWLRNGSAIVLRYVKRVEIFEMPEKPKPVSKGKKKT